MKVSKWWQHFHSQDDKTVPLMTGFTRGLQKSSIYGMEVGVFDNKQQEIEKSREKSAFWWDWWVIPKDKRQLLNINKAIFCPCWAALRDHR